MIRTRLVQWGVVALLCGMPLSAHAQNAPRGQGPGRGGDPPALAPIEVLNMLDAYALVQAQRALDMPDDQYGRFVVGLRQLQQTRRKNQQARYRMIQDLRRLAGVQVEQVDENALRDRLKALRDHDERAAAELRQAYEALDEVLDVRQQARFRIFEETLERRNLDLLMRARRAGGGRGQ